MNGYRLVASLVAAGQHRAAGELATLLAQREEEAPRMKALEYELAWLRQYVSRDGYPLISTAYSEDDKPIRWERDDSNRDPTWFVVPTCPRLVEILGGELPSLGAYKEGRTP